MRGNTFPTVVITMPGKSGNLRPNSKRLSGTIWSRNSYRYFNSKFNYELIIQGITGDVIKVDTLTEAIRQYRDCLNCGRKLRLHVEAAVACHII